MSDEWPIERDEVLIHKDSGRLYHVLGRLEDIDTGERYYELQDDTHTTREYWLEEDVKDTTQPTNVIVRYGFKPRQLLDGRMYDDEWKDQYLDKKTSSTD